MRQLFHCLQWYAGSESVKHQQHKETLPLFPPKKYKIVEGAANKILINFKTVLVEERW